MTLLAEARQNYEKTKKEIYTLLDSPDRLKYKESVSRDINNINADFSNWVQAKDALTKINGILDRTTTLINTDKVIYVEDESRIFEQAVGYNYELGQLDRNISKTSASLAAEQTALIAAKADIVAEQTALIAAKADIVAKQADIDRQRENINNKEAELKTSQLNLANSQTETQTCNEEITTIKKKLAAMEAVKQEALGKAMQCNDKLEKLKDERKTVDSWLSKKTFALETSEGKLKNEKNINNEYKKAIQSKDLALRELDKVRKEEQKILEGLTREILILREQLDKLDDTDEAKSKELDALELMVDEQEAANKAQAQAEQEAEAKAEAEREAEAKAEAEQEVAEAKAEAEREAEAKAEAEQDDKNNEVLVEISHANSNDSIITAMKAKPEHETAFRDAYNIYKKSDERGDEESLTNLEKIMATFEKMNDLFDPIFDKYKGAKKAEKEIARTSATTTKSANFATLYEAVLKIYIIAVKEAIELMESVMYTNGHDVNSNLNHKYADMLKKIDENENEKKNRISGGFEGVMPVMLGGCMDMVGIKQLILVVLILIIMFLLYMIWESYTQVKRRRYMAYLQHQQHQQHQHHQQHQQCN
jgi:hypothetical protein